MNIEELVERSSLGTTGARSLRARTPRQQAALLREVAELRNDMAHRRTGELALGAALEALHADEEAAEFYTHVAAQSLIRLAGVLERHGQHLDAEMWRQRARTIEPDAPTSPKSRSDHQPSKVPPTSPVDKVAFDPATTKRPEHTVRYTDSST